MLLAFYNAVCRMNAVMLTVFWCRLMAWMLLLWSKHADLRNNMLLPMDQLWVPEWQWFFCFFFNTFIHDSFLCFLFCWFCYIPLTFVCILFKIQMNLVLTVLKQLDKHIVWTEIMEISAWGMISALCSYYTIKCWPFHRKGIGWSSIIIEPIMLFNSNMYLCKIVHARGGTT